MDAKPPDRPPVVVQLDPEVKRRLDLMYKNKGKEKPTIEVRDFGPIARMSLGTDWKDLGVGPKFKDKSHGGGLVQWHSYRIEEPRCTLRIYGSPRPHSDKRANEAKTVVDT
ncbi:MAG: hypothetical protein K8F91_18980, partial [Candidatus Obscuribacterales bacterium]|nr:hypothetical protein [Candidatus Obscuribacterales bacterium]